MRSILSISMLVAVMAAPPVAQEKPASAPVSLAGAWTRNQELSDAPAGVAAASAAAAAWGAAAVAAWAAATPTR